MKARIAKDLNCITQGPVVITIMLFKLIPEFINRDDKLGYLIVLALVCVFPFANGKIISG